MCADKQTGRGKFKKEPALIIQHLRKNIFTVRFVDGRGDQKFDFDKVKVWRAPPNLEEEVQLILVGSVCTCVRVCVCIVVAHVIRTYYIHTYTQTYIHTHKHTYIHIHKTSMPCRQGQRISKHHHMCAVVIQIHSDIHTYIYTYIHIQMPHRAARKITNSSNATSSVDSKPAQNHSVRSASISQEPGENAPKRPKHTPTHKKQRDNDDHSMYECATVGTPASSRVHANSGAAHTPSANRTHGEDHDAMRENDAGKSTGKKRGVAGSVKKGKGTRVMEDAVGPEAASGPKLSREEQKMLAIQKQ